jgi:hypothetical protein
MAINFSDIFKFKDVSQLKLYDRLVRFDKNNNMYYHDALYLDNNIVFEVNLDIKENPSKTLISEFYNSSIHVIIVFRYTLELTDIQNINDIHSRVNNMIKWHYDLQQHNCEHFVSFCLFGKKHSHQINNIKKLGMIAIIKFSNMKNMIFSKNNNNNNDENNENDENDEKILEIIKDIGNYIF